MFVNQFLSSVAEYLEETDQYTELLDEWSQPIDAKANKRDAFDLLNKRITWFCKQCSKKIILMIDEVDKSSDNQVFLHFWECCVTSTSNVWEIIFQPFGA